MTNLSYKKIVYYLYIIYKKMNNPRNEWSAHWTDETKETFDVKMKDGTFKPFQKGTWVKLPGRNDKVMIDSIISPYNNHDTSRTPSVTTNVGPLGITYLPWREDEKRFASMSYTIRGNQRFIICYPVGITHYGQHVDWDLVEITSPPDDIDQYLDLVKEVLERTTIL
jgi:hypothetical protein